LAIIYTPVSPILFPLTSRLWMKLRLFTITLQDKAVIKLFLTYNSFKFRKHPISGSCFIRS
jgi:hypothetical protein